MFKLFEFKCHVCGETKEAMVKGFEDYPMCPQDHTHGVMLKIISASSFHFANGEGTNAGKAWAFRNKPMRT